MAELEAADLFPHLEQMLEPPLQRSTDGTHRARPSVRGTFAGRPTAVRLAPDIHDYGDDGSSYLSIEMEGKTYDLVGTIVPTENQGGVKTGDAEFDARFLLDGASPSVLRQLFGAELRGLMLRFPSNIRFDRDRLTLSFCWKASTLASAAAQLTIAARILDALPGAMRAAGAASYLEIGSLKTHPELVFHAATRSQRRLTLLALVASFGAVLVLGAIVIALVAWWRWG